MVMEDKNAFKRHNTKDEESICCSLWFYAEARKSLIGYCQSLDLPEIQSSAFLRTTLVKATMLTEQCVDSSKTSSNLAFEKYFD